MFCPSEIVTAMSKSGEMPLVRGIHRTPKWRKIEKIIPAARYIVAG